MNRRNLQEEIKRFEKIAGITTVSKPSKKLKENLYEAEEDEDAEEDDTDSVEDTDPLEVDLDSISSDDESDDMGISDSDGGDAKDQIQKYLTNAQKAAKSLGDEVLMGQIGNTLTYFIRNHVAKID